MWGVGPRKLTPRQPSPWRWRWCCGWSWPVPGCSAACPASSHCSSPELLYLLQPHLQAAAQSWIAAISAPPGLPEAQKNPISQATVPKVSASSAEPRPLLPTVLHTWARPGEGPESRLRLAPKAPRPRHLLRSAGASGLLFEGFW